MKRVVIEVLFAAVLASACAGQGAATSAMASADTLRIRQGHKVMLTGMARNAKAGAVIVLDGGEPVYLEGVAAWPPDLEGRKVSASGTLRQKKHIPEPVAPSGEIRQGAEGEQMVLETPEWRAAP